MPLLNAVYAPIDLSWPVLTFMAFLGCGRAIVPLMLSSHIIRMRDVPVARFPARGYPLRSRWSVSTILTGTLTHQNCYSC
jgi:hypothetical protein